MVKSCIPIVDGCCFGISLKTGVKIIAYLETVLLFLSLILCAIYASTFTSVIPSPTPTPTPTPTPLSSSSSSSASSNHIGTKFVVYGTTTNVSNDNADDLTEFNIVFYSIWAGSCVIGLIITILLIVGVHKNKPNYFIPWLILTSLSIVGNLLIIIAILCAVPDSIEAILKQTINLVVSIYFWIIVHNFSRQMRMEQTQSTEPYSKMNFSA